MRVCLFTHISISSPSADPGRKIRSPWERPATEDDLYAWRIVDSIFLVDMQSGNFVLMPAIQVGLNPSDSDVPPAAAIVRLRCGHRCRQTATGATGDHSGGPCRRFISSGTTRPRNQKAEMQTLGASNHERRRDLSARRSVARRDLVCGRKALIKDHEQAVRHVRESRTLSLT